MLALTTTLPANGHSSSATHGVGISPNSPVNWQPITGRPAALGGFDSRTVILFSSIVKSFGLVGMTPRLSLMIVTGKYPCVCPLYSAPQSLPTAVASKSLTTKLRTAAVLRFEGGLRRNDRADPGMLLAEQPRSVMLPCPLSELKENALPQPPLQRE